MIILPMIYFGDACILTYDWIMQFQTAVAGSFVIAFSHRSFDYGPASASNTLNSLVVDVDYRSIAPAVATNNLCG